MPRTNGVYAPPAGTKGVPNTTILSARYNALVEDLTADANAARPVTAGGTGATSASAARTALGLSIGTDVQAQNPLLQAIAGLTTAANQIIYTTAPNVVATAALTAFGRSVISAADAAALRTLLTLDTLYYTKTAADGRYYTKTEIDNLIAANRVQVGESILWNSLTIPSGFMKENGAAISRTAYPELFAAIGTTFGAGNGSTTFNLPDSRGEFFRGLDDGRGIDTGRTLGSSQASQNLLHAHQRGTLAVTINSAGAHNHSSPGDIAAPTGTVNVATGPGYRFGPRDTSTDGAHVHGATVSGATASEGGDEARPRNVAKLILIRAF